MRRKNRQLPKRLEGARKSMPTSLPLATIETLVCARNRGEVEVVMACYERTAAIVPIRGTNQSGPEALRTWVQSFGSLRAELAVISREIIVGGGIALHCSAWRLKGTDQAGNLSRRRAEALMFCEGSPTETGSSRSTIRGVPICSRSNGNKQGSGLQADNFQN
jgi:ketosteroid isomerase-like protein